MADSPSYVPQTTEINPVKQNVAIQQLYTSVADAASAADAAALKTTTITAGTGLTGGGDLSANRTIALGVPVAVANGGTGATTAAAARGNLAAATTTQTDFICGIIKAPVNQTYLIIDYIPYGATFTLVEGRTATGTLTATWKINTTVITGGALAVTTTPAASVPSANNVIGTANTLALTISAVSGATDFSFVVAFTRTLA